MRNHAHIASVFLDTGSYDPPRHDGAPGASDQGRGNEEQGFSQRSKTTIRLLRAVAQGEEDARHKRVSGQDEVWDRLEKKLQCAGE